MTVGHSEEEIARLKSSKSQFELQAEEAGVDRFKERLQQMEKVEAMEQQLQSIRKQDVMVFRCLDVGCGVCGDTSSPSLCRCSAPRLSANTQPRRARRHRIAWRKLRRWSASSPATTAMHAAAPSISRSRLICASAAPGRPSTRARARWRCVLLSADCAWHHTPCRSGPRTSKCLATSFCPEASSMASTCTPGWTK